MKAGGGGIPSGLIEMISKNSLTYLPSEWVLNGLAIVQQKQILEHLSCFGLN